MEGVGTEQALLGKDSKARSLRQAWPDRRMLQAAGAKCGADPGRQALGAGVLLGCHPGPHSALHGAAGLPWGGPGLGSCPQRWVSASAGPWATCSPASGAGTKPGSRGSRLGASSCAPPRRRGESGLSVLPRPCPAPGTSHKASETPPPAGGAAPALGPRAQLFGAEATCLEPAPLLAPGKHQ